MLFWRADGSATKKGKLKPCVIWSNLIGKVKQKLYLRCLPTKHYLHLLQFSWKAELFKFLRLEDKLNGKAIPSPTIVWSDGMNRKTSGANNNDSRCTEQGVGRLNFIIGCMYFLAGITDAIISE